MKRRILTIAMSVLMATSTVQPVAYGQAVGGVDVDSATASDATVDDELSDEELSMETVDWPTLSEYKDSAIQLDTGEYTTDYENSQGALVYSDNDGEITEGFTYGKMYKFTVPAEDTYILSYVSSHFIGYYTDEAGIADIDGYSEGMKSWSECNMGLYNEKLNGSMYKYTFVNNDKTPKTFYLWIDECMDDGKYTFEIIDVKGHILSFDEALDSAEELEAGKYTFDNKDYIWSYIDSGLSPTDYDPTLGSIYKITVPAYTTYNVEFVTKDAFCEFIRFYDYYGNYGVCMSHDPSRKIYEKEDTIALTNTKNTDETYYMILVQNDKPVEVEITEKDMLNPDDEIYVYGSILTIDDSFYEKYPEYEGKITNVYFDVDIDTMKYMASQTKGDCLFCVSEKDLDELYESGLFADLEDIGVDVSLYDGFDYTKDIGTYNGKLKAVTDSVNPGCFEYDVDIAEKVLGFSDPDKVQECLSTPEKFLETAEKMKKAGYYMTSGIDNWYWMTNFSFYGDDETVWKNLCNALIDNGYDTGHTTWSELESDMSDGTTFGEFTYPEAICENYFFEGERSRNICAGPLSLYKSGYYYLATSTGKNDDIVKDVIETIFCDTDYMYTMSSIVPFVNNKAVIEKIIKNNSSDYELIDLTTYDTMRDCRDYEGKHIVSNPYPTWYSIANKLGEGYIETTVSGDVTGDNDVNISDLMLVLNHVSGKNALTGNAFTAGDVNGDGKVDLQDLMRILNYVSGKSKEL